MWFFTTNIKHNEITFIIIYNIILTKNETESECGSVILESVEKIKNNVPTRNSYLMDNTTIFHGILW